MEMELKKDYSNAMKYYEKAAELGISAALAMIGKKHYYGNGVEKRLLKSRR